MLRLYSQHSKMKIEIAKKFEPLFQLLNADAYKEVDTVILTGGRASSKSFTVALFALYACVELSWKILYSRFTNLSIGDSIKAEVSDKIELMGYEDKMKDNLTAIISKENEGKISFKGIKTGSKGQTANLKSLSGFNVFIVDEAEEIPSFETFKKVFYSIRSVNKRNISILILNPTVRNHWIYQKYFAKHKVKDGFCGVIDNVMYIHSSYLDVNPEYIPENIKKDYDRLKLEDIEEYTNIVKGGWKRQLDGVLFPKSDLNFYENLPTDKKLIAKLSFVDIADEGDDNHSVPVGYIYDDGSIYIEEVVFTQHSMSSNVPMTANILNDHRVDYARVENNFGGSAYVLLLQPLIKNKTELIPARATSNKHSRILNSQYKVKRHVYFKSSYEDDAQYNAFMNNVFDYLKDGESPHDDAPDSVEGLLQFAQSLFPHLYL